VLFILLLFFLDSSNYTNLLYLLKISVHISVKMKMKICTCFLLHRPSVYTGNMFDSCLGGTYIELAPRDHIPYSFLCCCSQYC
jgi:hypothetical protein